MGINVHLLYSPNKEVLDLLRSLLDPEIHLTIGDEEDVIADCHILVGGRPAERHLQACKALRALIIPWAGLPKETAELMKQFPSVAIHNLHHNADPVAELAFALLLAAAKIILPLDKSLRRHDWTPRYQSSSAMLLAGKTALVLGYGAIGKRVARFCQAFGMRVTATKRRPTASLDDGIQIHPSTDLNDLLPDANAIIICLPLTAATEGLIGARALDLLPDPAVLVNIGRGAIVDEEALFHALRDSKLHAAGLDVWYNYPGSGDEAARTNTPPSRYPFHELENVVMSPHRGGASDETDVLRMKHLATLLNLAAAGKQMPNRVDLQTGY